VAPDPRFSARCCPTPRTNRALGDAIRHRLEIGHDRIADLHVWRSARAITPPSCRWCPTRAAGRGLQDAADDLRGLSHVTVEGPSLQRCPLIMQCRRAEPSLPAPPFSRRCPSKVMKPGRRP